MPSECLDEDWIIELNVRPNGMSPIDPPLNDHNEYYSRLLLSHYVFLASLAYNGEYSQEHLLQQYFRWWMNGIHILNVLKLSTIVLKRMFGRETSTDVFVAYIELLVNALNGLLKQEGINLIKLKKNSNDYLNRFFFDLIDLILNDNNNIEQGVQLALEKQFIERKECQYLNPLDSNENILLTLYLQISAAIYNSIHDQWLNNIYAKNTIESLIKWIIYRRNQNLHSF
ncbi:unnamed protein product [Rotaria magnacalcarata]|uniref:Uncharacterized protein n=3 Tax=Rotaria magnacalcarata TaxID=392030 RepID=A0A8S2ZS25_9BILA|nr:unnamed protein product [Rotaria magnacalcarata]